MTLKELKSYKILKATREMRQITYNKKKLVTKKSKDKEMRFPKGLRENNCELRISTPTKLFQNIKVR